MQLDDVHGRHRESSSVDHASDFAIEFDVVESGCAGLRFEWFLGSSVAQLSQFRMPEQCRIIKIHFGIECNHAVVIGDDQRINLDN